MAHSKTLERPAVTEARDGKDQKRLAATVECPEQQITALDRIFMAVTFSEAGEFETAKSLLKAEPDER